MIVREVGPLLMPMPSSAIAILNAQFTHIWNSLRGQTMAAVAAAATSFSSSSSFVSLLQKILLRKQSLTATELEEEQEDY